MEPEDMQADGLQEQHEGVETLSVQDVPQPEAKVYPAAEATEHALGGFEAHLRRGGLTVRLDRAHVIARLAPVVSLLDVLHLLQEAGARLEGSGEGPHSAHEQAQLRLHLVQAVQPQEESHAVRAGATILGPNGDRYAVQ